MAKKAKRKPTEEQQDLQRVLSTVSGRNVIWRLLDSGGVNSNPFNVDQRTTDLNCGALGLAQEFLDDILTVCPHRYLEMIQEHNPGLEDQPIEDDDDVD